MGPLDLEKDSRRSNLFRHPESFQMQRRKDTKTLSVNTFNNVLTMQRCILLPCISLTNRELAKNAERPCAFASMR